MNESDVGIQNLIFTPQRHYVSTSKSVMGGATTRTAFLQRPGQLSRRSAQTAEGRQCVTESLSDSVQFLKKPLIKKFNIRLNHIIQSMCFLFQIHSCITIKPVGPKPAVLHTLPHTYSHTQPHVHKIRFFFSPVFPLNFLFFNPYVFPSSLSPSYPTFIAFTGSEDVFGSTCVGLSDA